MAKLFATETAAEVSLEAMRIMGGNGFSKDFPVERLLSGRAAAPDWRRHATKSSVSSSLANCCSDTPSRRPGTGIVRSGGCQLLNGWQAIEIKLLPLSENSFDTALGNHGSMKFVS